MVALGGRTATHPSARMGASDWTAKEEVGRKKKKKKYKQRVWGKSMVTRCMQP